LIIDAQARGDAFIASQGLILQPSQGTEQLLGTSRDLRIHLRPHAAELLQKATLEVRGLLLAVALDLELNETVGGNPWESHAEPADVRSLV